jgi:ribosomal protein S27AE
MLDSSKKGVVWKLNCPNCGKLSIAEIFWGYPADMKEIEKEIDEGKIVLGGCIITNHDPKWECNKCHHRWGNREDDEVDSDNTSSFDFDKGFNLDEVYDK